MCSDSCQTALSSPKDGTCLLFQSVNLTVTALLIIHEFWIASYIPQMEQSLGTSALPGASQPSTAPGRGPGSVPLASAGDTECLQHKCSKLANCCPANVKKLFSGVLGAVPGMRRENRVSQWCFLTFPFF